jgi:glutamine cyclotransferase
MDGRYFAEGLSITNDDKIYQLTYKENDVLVWNFNRDTNKINLVETKGWPKNNQLTQGWGLAYRYDPVA